MGQSKQPTPFNSICYTNLIIFCMGYDYGPSFSQGTGLVCVCGGWWGGVVLFIYPTNSF